MRIESWQADQPYNTLPPLPPRVDIESKPVLKQCIKARAALAELKQAAALIPNQSVLINTLPLLEAGASSGCGGGPAASMVTGEVIYTPPVGEALIRDKLANLEQFLHNAVEVDPLIRLAVTHYQFEAIHPFTDGNGRTGRVVNSLFLIQEGLLTLPILYLSRYIIKHKSDYYRLLLGVTREQDWESWILFMLHGIEDTAVWTTAKIAAIKGLSEHTTEYVRKRLPKVYSHELVSLIFEPPYCRNSSLNEAGVAKRQAASQYLKQLVEIGVLVEAPTTKEKLFIHPKLMQLLTRDRNEFTPYDLTS